MRSFALLGLPVLLLLPVSASAVAEGQKTDACADWGPEASNVMFRVAAAQSRTEEGIDLLTDLMERHNAGEKSALSAYERERKRFDKPVQEAVAASQLAAQEAKRLNKLLKEVGSRCPETELHGLKWAGWWFANHGPRVKMRAAYLAAARLDVKKAESIFEEVIKSSGNSDDVELKGHIDLARRSLEVLKRGEIPSLGRRQFGQQENVTPLVPHPRWSPKPGVGKP